MSNFKRPRKQRPRYNHVINKNNKVNYLPYVHIKDCDNLLFFANTDIYDIETISNWVKIFSEAFPKVNFCVMPDNMFYAVPKITGKEYTMINNIIRRCKEKLNN